MKTLKFRGFKARMILDGTKTASIRLFDDKAIVPGDELSLVNSDSGETFARVRVTEVVEKKLGDINEGDLQGHERYENSDAMLQNLRGHYGETVHPDTPAKIIRFTLEEKLGV